MTALLGLKIGMTRIFNEQGKTIPVTAIEVGPCTITQIRTLEKDSYQAIQVGFGSAHKPNKAQVGHAGENITPRFVREFRVDDLEGYAVGQIVDCSALSIGDSLRLTATSKGKGFSGVIKRYHFSRGPETHGSDHHRAPGSIGAMYPQHVLKGKKMPGRMGNEQVTVRKVKVVDIEVGKNLIFVKGPVPGTPGGLVEISVM